MRIRASAIDNIVTAPRENNKMPLSSPETTRDSSHDRLGCIAHV